MKDPAVARRFGIVAAVLSVCLAVASVGVNASPTVLGGCVAGVLLGTVIAVAGALAEFRSQHIGADRLGPRVMMRSAEVAASPADTIYDAWNNRSVTTNPPSHLECETDPHSGIGPWQRLDGGDSPQQSTFSSLDKGHTIIAGD